MSYQKKYYYTFKDIDNNTHRIEVYENTATTITPVEVKAALNPFIIDFGSISKFDTILGSGAEINLVSESNMFFFNNLFHVDMQQFMVKHYINDSINWLGYLNSELFQESFTELDNYDIQVTANDGFSLMDRIMFVDSSKNNYTGIKSYFDILQIIFDKIGLPFNELRVSLSTSITNVADTTSTTLFHGIRVNCDNFYDEDNKPMSLKEVLDEMLKPFQAYIFQDKGNIYLSDYNNKASNSTITYKRYSISNLANYLGTVVESNVKALTKYDYQNLGGDISTGAGINRQVVSYSPYPKNTLLEAINTVKEFGSTGTYTTNNGYVARQLYNNSYIQEHTPATFQQSYSTDANSTDTYLKIPFSSVGGTTVATLKFAKYVVVNNAFDSVPLGTFARGLSLRITGNMRAVTKLDTYNEDSTGQAINGCAINCKLRVGSKYAQNFGINWNDTPTNVIIQARDDNSSISDKWTAIGNKWFNYATIIPIKGYDQLHPVDLNGTFYLDISNNMSYSIGDTFYPDNTGDKVQEVWLKDLKVELVDIDTHEPIDSDDVEYIATLDSSFKNEGKKIELKIGTDTFFNDNAKLLNSSNQSIRAFSRGNLSGKRIEELLLNSVVSNYQQSNVAINSLSLKNIYNLNNIITTPYFSGKQFCITALTTNYSNCTSDLGLTEIFTDNLTI